MSIAGSISINFMKTLVDAYVINADVYDASSDSIVNRGSMVTGATGVDVNASITPTMIIVAGGASFSSGGVAAALAVAVNDMRSVINARVEGTDTNVTATSGNVSIAAEVLKQDALPTNKVELYDDGDADSDEPILDAQIWSFAVSGALSTSSFAAAGALTTNWIRNDVDAHISNSAEVHADNGFLRVKASDRAGLNSIAGGLAGGSGGAIGGAISYNYIGGDPDSPSSQTRNQINASIDDAVVTARTVQVTALSDGDINSFSLAAAGTTGAFAASVSLSLNFIRKNVTADIGDGAQVTTTGDVLVEAKDASSMMTGVGQISVATSGGGFGAAIGYNDISNIVDASVTGGAAVTVRAGETGNVIVRALSESEVGTVAAGLSGGSGAAIAGSATANIIDNDVKAYVTGTGTEIVTDDNVLVYAESDDEIKAYAGSLGIGLSAVGGGGTVVSNEITNATSAYISGEAAVTALGSGAGIGVKSTAADSSPTTTVNGLAVVANAETEFVVVSVAAGGSSGVGIGLSVGLSRITNSVNAYIIDSSINTEAMRGNQVRVSAHQLTDVASIGGTAGIGISGAGFGATADVTLVNNTTQAYIKDTGGAADIDAIYAAGGVVVKAQSEETFDATVIGIGGGTGVGAGGSGAALDTSSTTKAYIQDAVVRSYGNIEIDADSSRTVLTRGGSVGVGAGGLGATVVVGLFSGSTQAYTIGSNLRSEADPSVPSSTGGSIIIDADSTERLDVSAGTLGAGGFGFAGTVSVMQNSTHTTAYMGAGTRAYAVQGVSITADNTVDINQNALSILGSVAIGGTAGIGATIEVITVQNTVDAHIGSNSVITTIGDVVVDATAVRNIDSTTIAGAAAGYLAVSGAISVISVGSAPGSGAVDEASAAEGIIGDAFSEVSGSVDDAVTQDTDASYQATGSSAGAPPAVSLSGSTADYSTRAYLGDGVVIQGMTFDILDLDLETRNLGFSNQERTVTLDSVTDGAFRFVWGTQATDVLRFDASAAEVTQAITGLAGIGTSDLTVVKRAVEDGPGWDITFTGAVNVNNLGLQIVPSGVADEVQTLTLDGVTDGVFRLDWGTQTTDLIRYDASASEFKRALTGLVGIGVNDVSVVATANGWDVTFTGVFAGQTGIPVLSLDDDSSTPEVPTGEETSTGAKVTFQESWINGTVTAAITNVGGELRASPGSIAVTATETVSVDVIDGAVALSGGASVAGSVSFVDLDSNTLAYVGNDGSLETRGDLSIVATYNANADVLVVGGAGGLVGLGAQVTYLTDSSSQSAWIGNSTGDSTGAGIVRADNVLISAVANRDFEFEAIGVSVGLAAAGAAIGSIEVTGATTAYIGNYTQIGRDTSNAAFKVNDVSVFANSLLEIDGEVTSVAAGIGAGAGNSSTVDFTPTVTAYVGKGSKVDVTGELSVRGNVTPEIDIDMLGVSAGVLAVGVSLSEVNYTPTVVAMLGTPVGGVIPAGGDVVVNADSLVLSATTSIADIGTVGSADGGEQNQGISTRSTGSSGALVGVNATLSEVTTDSTVTASIASGSTIALTGALTVASVNTTRQRADSDANTGGIVAAGIVEAIVSSTSNTHANVAGNVKISSASVSVSAFSTDNNFAVANAGSGGVVAGASAVAETDNTSFTTASIGRGTASRGVDVSGDVEITAAHVANFDGKISTVGGGAIAGSGADIEHDISSTVTAQAADNAYISAGGVAITAENTLNKTNVGVDGVVGGAIAGAGAGTDIDIRINTQALIGDSASVNVVGSLFDPGDLTLSAKNILNIYATNTLTAGGLGAGADATIRIITNEMLSRAQVGQNASVTSIGDLNLSARGEGFVQSAINIETYGAVTVGIADNDVTITPTNEVIFAAGSNAVAQGNLNLMAGIGTDITRDQYTISARTDSFAGSAIPVDDIDARAILNQTNYIEIGSGALLQTGGEAKLYAEDIGFANMTGKAKAVNWASAAVDGINSLLGGGGEDQYSGFISTNADGSIRNDGEIRTGINRNQTLEILALTPITGEPEFGINSGNFEVNVGREKLESGLFKELEDAQKALSQYGETSPKLKEYFESEIVRIKAALDARGLLDTQADGSTTAVRKDALTLNVAPIRAEAGAILLRGQQLLGSGTFNAPGDATITITNNTAAQLNIFGAVIPESEGGTFLNGLAVTDSTVAVSSGLNFLGGPSGVDPSISISNTFRTSDNPGTPAPALKILGEVSVLNGLLDLRNIDGDVVIEAQVRSKDLNVVAGGDFFVTGLSDFASGGEPYSLWSAESPGELIDNRVEVPFEVTAFGITLKGTKVQIVETLFGEGEGVGKITASDVNNLLLTGPSEENIIYGDRVFIDAEYINLNGVIQSGKDQYTLTIDSAVGAAVADILSKIASGQMAKIGEKPLLLEEFSDEDFALYLNSEGQLVVGELRASGGTIELVGHLLNTGNGEIRLLSGYSSITVENSTQYDVVLERLDVSQRGKGLLVLADKAKGSSTEPAVTMYEKAELGDATTTGAKSIIDTLEGANVVVGLKALLLVEDKPIGVATSLADLVPELTAEQTDLIEARGDISYTRTATGVEVRFAGQIISTSSAIAYDDAGNDSATYTIGTGNPADGVWRSGFAVDVDKSLFKEKLKVTAAWLGIDAFAADPGTIRWDSVRVDGLPVLADEGIYYYLDTSLDEDAEGNILKDQAYNYALIEINREAPGEVLEQAHWTESSWYGKKTYYTQYAQETKVTQTHQHDIRADYDVKISFLGSAGGSIDISSTNANADVYLNGDLRNSLNTAGTTTVSSAGSIFLKSEAATIGGYNVDLSAGGDIGSLTIDADGNTSDLGAVTVTLGDGDLSARATSGNIFLRSTTGDLTIDSVVAGGDVKLVSAAGVVKSSSGTGLIEGGSIEIIAKTGAVGESAAQALVLDSGDDLRDVVNLTAKTDIYIKELLGNLRLEQAVAETGRVYINLLDIREGYGSLIDANTTAERDERSRELLISTVWSALRLTEGTGALDKIEDAYSLIEDSRARDYMSYWTVRDATLTQDADYEAYWAARNVQLATEVNGELSLDDDGNFEITFDTYAANSRVILGNEERAEYVELFTELYQNEADVAAAVEAAITAIEDERTEAFHTLHDELTARDPSYTASYDPRFGTITFDDYDATYRVSLSAGEVAYYQAFYTEQGRSQQDIQAAITTLENKRTAEFHTLHLQLETLNPEFVASYDPLFASAYQLDPDSAEAQAIRDSIKIWTEDDLMSLLGSGLLKPVTDTTTLIEEANIVAPLGVELITAGAVGSNDDTLLIAADGDYTEDEQVALAATERLDIAFLSQEQAMAVTVNFTSVIGAGDTITRASGDWVAEGFVAGMQIRIDGNSGNSSEGGGYYQIATVTEKVLTLVADTGAGAESLLRFELVTEVAKTVDIAAVIADPSAINALRTDPGSTWDGYDVNDVVVRGDEYLLVARADQAVLVLNVLDNDALSKLTRAQIDNAKTFVAPSDLRYATIATIALNQKNDIDLTGAEDDSIPTAEIIVDAGGFVYLGSERDLLIKQIEAGGDVRLKGGSSILAAPGYATPLIQGANLILEASQGTIGVYPKDGDDADITNIRDLPPTDTSGALIIDITGSLTARADGFIYVVEQDGDMNLETAYSATDTVRLKTLNGSILDANSNDFENIRANRIELVSSADIGDTNNFVDVNSLTTTDTVWVYANSDIFVAESEGNLQLDEVRSVTGNVSLRAQFSIIDAVDFDEDGNPLSLDSLPGIDVYATGGSIDLEATLGTIGESGNDLDIDSGSAVGRTLNTASFGNTFIIEVLGDLYLKTASTDIAATNFPYTAFIAAPDGSIYNGNPGNDNVVSGKVYLFAADHIGTQALNLATSVGSLEGVSTTGSTWITNTGAAEVGGVIATSVVPGLYAGSSVNVTTKSPLTINKDIYAGITFVEGEITASDSDDKDIVLWATDDNDAEADNLTIVDGITVRTLGGDIFLLGGDDVLVEAGASVIAETNEGLGGNIVVQADFDSADVGGGQVTIDGTLTADQKIEIGGSEEDDTILLRGEISAGDESESEIVIKGRGGNDNISIGEVDALGIALLDGNTQVFGDYGPEADLLSAKKLVLLGGVAATRSDDGEDLITLYKLHSRTDSLLLDGEGATDNYHIFTTSIDVDGARTSYTVDVSDSGRPDDGVDRLVIEGQGMKSETSSAAEDEDVFLIRKNFVARLQADGDVKDRNFFAEYERINYDESINGRMRINSWAGDDYFFVDDTSTIITLDGGRGKDLFQVGQVYGVNPSDPAFLVDGVYTNSGVLEGDEIAGTMITRGFLSVGASSPLVLFGGEDADQFFVYSNKAELRMEGEGGNDNFVIRAFVIAPDNDIIANGGDDDDTFEYNINAPVTINGGEGFDTVVAIGTEKDDAFIITEDGIFGAGLNIRLDGVEEAIEADGLEGDDTFYILSTAAGLVTTVIGGLGSDAFEVAGDVTKGVISQSLDGRSGVINHGTISLLDPDYNDLVADGVSVTVASLNGEAKITVTPSGSGTTVTEGAVDGENGWKDEYTIALNVPIELMGEDTVVYLTVSAAMASTHDRRLPRTTEDGDPAESIEISIDGTNWSSAAVLSFSAADWMAGAWVGKKVYVRAANDDALEGERIVMISHDIIVENDQLVGDTGKTLFEDVVISNMAVVVKDDDKGGLLITETGSGTRVLEGVNVDEDGSMVYTGFTDTYTIELNLAPKAGVDIVVEIEHDSRVALSAAADAGRLSYLRTTESGKIISALIFDDTNWNQAVEITVEAPADMDREISSTQRISHTILASTDPAYATARSFEINVDVRDDDAPRVLITETDGGTRVIEGQPADTYSVRLVKAPAADVTVLLFSDGQTNLEGDRVVYVDVRPLDMGADGTGIDATASDNTLTRNDETSWVDAKYEVGMLVRVSDANDAGLFELMKINALDESLMTFTSELELTAAATAFNIQLVGYGVTFTADNWYQEVDVEVTVDSEWVLDPDQKNVRKEPFREHSLSKIQGPLIIEGGVSPNKDRSLNIAVMLPYETAEDPIDADIITDETKQADSITLYNDSSSNDDAFVMQSVELDIPDFLTLGDSAINVTGSGLSAEKVIDLSEAQDGSGEYTIPGGITFDDIEVTEVLLGRGNDTFMIYATSTGTPGAEDNLITVIHGGGNTDTSEGVRGRDAIVAYGADSPLVLYGDTSQDASRYDARPSLYEYTGNGAFFSNFGDDYIDARKLTSSVTIYGGAGNDTIYGGKAGDHIAGGSGNDRIFAGSGNDHVYGDSGFNVDYEILRNVDDSGEAFVARVISVPTVNASVLANADSLVAGLDQIYGQNGEDIIVGDHGEIDQLDGTLRILTTDYVTAVRTVESANGAMDIVRGGRGNDVILGGGDSDYLYGQQDDDIIHGDFAQLSWVYQGGEQYLSEFRTLDVDHLANGNDKLYGWTGNDILLGGSGDDYLRGWLGDDVIHGDSATLSWVIDGNAAYLQTLVTTAGGNGGVDRLDGRSGDDVMIGGGNADKLWGREGNDILHGDSATITWSNQPSGVAVSSITTTFNAVGGVDWLRGEEGDDVLIGGTRADYIDGGTNDDLIFGDNVDLDRSARFDDFTNMRFQQLTGSAIYDTGFGENGASNDVLLTGNAELVPEDVYSFWGDFEITLKDHTKNTGSAYFGDDYIAGGADSDQIFGQLGDDTIQGDGTIDRIDSATRWVGGLRDSSGLLVVAPSIESETDGDDYIEGNGGSDIIFGNLGQDDIIGGSSEFFGLGGDMSLRPDGADIIFGGAGTDLERSNDGDTSVIGHARDADTIAGDNANIMRVVGVVGDGTQYLEFVYDQSSSFEDRGDLRIVPRAVELLDYTLGGDHDGSSPVTDIGAGDEIHGESGDDTIYGMVGNDVLFGEGQDDDIIGGWGHDWISGGTGRDGVLGDDGRIFTSRNGSADPLNGVVAIAADDLNKVISSPGKVQIATINVSGELKKTVNLTPFNVDPADSDPLYDAANADDLIYGGLGGDWLHGGAGDDGISGAEALAEYYDNPVNAGGVLQYNIATGEFALYDEYSPRTLVTYEDGRAFELNFDHTEGVAAAQASVGDGLLNSDGDDRIFGDLGNDWLVGGTGNDNIYGGWGDDLINVDDDHTTNAGLNDVPDTAISYEDRAFGGAGRDRLIANTGGDRLIDWAGEFNSYIVPFAPFGNFTVSRAPQPALADFLYDLSESDGADQTRSADTGNDAARNGEPDGELGLIRQSDFAWQDQTGSPDDPQPGNIPGGSRDVLRSANFNSGSLETFAVDSGNFTAEAGRLTVETESLGGDSVAVFQFGDAIPTYFELQATVSMDRATGGYKANAYLIFDYYSENDFKYAGMDDSTNKFVIGHRDSSGWHVDAQTSVKGGVKPNKDYNMLLSVNGLTVTLLVDNASFFGHTFEAREYQGYTYGLNFGLVGMGSDNARGTFDNVAVLVLPPELTYEDEVDFEETADFDQFVPSESTGGQWQVVEAVAANDGADGEPVTAATDGGYQVVVEPETGGLVVGTSFPAISLYDIDQLGGEGVATNAVLQLGVNVNTDGSAGIVYDQYDDETYKFFVLDVLNQQILLGHSTAAGGWEVDASFDMDLEAGVDYDLDLSLKGSTVSAKVNGYDVLGYIYNAAVVDGSFGVLGRSGTTTFDDFSVETDDRRLEEELIEVSDATEAEAPVEKTMVLDEESGELVAAVIASEEEEYLILPPSKETLRDYVAA